MGTDRNTVIGFILLALLFFGYFYYNQQGQIAVEKKRVSFEDSASRVKRHNDSIQIASPKADTLRSNLPSDTGTIKVPVIQEQAVIIENDVLKINFTNKGAQPKTIELIKYKTFNGEPLILQNGSFNKISYAVNTGNNQIGQSSELYFLPSALEKGSDGSQNISFTFKAASGETITHRYVIPAEGYMIDMIIEMAGADKLVTNNTLNLSWQAQAQKVEKDMKYERLQSQVAYVEDGDYDFHIVATGDDKKLSKPVDWITLKQQFFSTAIIAKSKFQNAEVQWNVPADTSKHIIAQAIANMRLNVPSSNTQIPLQLFYGPNDYKTLKSYNNGMYNIVPLGSGMTAFVKYINRGFVMPVFNFLAKNIGSFGLVIALLTIIIRLLISPLTYQSYLSGAKMKLLKPEVDALKTKYGEDKQTFGMEQMKLFRSAGVNPLGGCIPALLQIPIFFALYNFFNSNIDLRGQSFWWAKDLSSYDSIYNFGFNVPLYGNHISLFTIFAVVTSLLISLYGMSNMQDNNNPMMKYLPFIFPVVLLGVFNDLPSALTWYYTVSNVITLLIQFVIQKYIIDHQKILAQLQANKLKPVTKSKWQQRVDAMQDSNKKLQELKEKTGKGKNFK
ncbi:membrane protein insertase YidC [soil metagenome]